MAARVRARRDGPDRLVDNGAFDGVGTRLAHHAGAHARLLPADPHHATRAGADAGSAAQRLRQVRPRARPARAAHPFQACPAQYADPGRHHCRPAARIGDRLCHRHRERVPVAGARRAIRAGRAVCRHSRDGRLLAVRGRRVRRRQPDRRPALLRPRPAPALGAGLGSDPQGLTPTGIEREAQMEYTRPTPRRPEPLKARLARAWDSDLAWRYRHSPMAITASFTTIVIVLLALLAPLIAPQNAFDPAAVRLEDGFLKPMERSPSSGLLHVLGTDGQGRDLLSAILYGGRISLLVGFAAVGFSMALGVTLGLIAGFLGGRIDAVLMRITDVQLSFPALLIALLVFGVGRGLVPPSQHEQMAIIVLIVAIGLSHWAQYARTVRGSTMVEKNKEYVLAARGMGGGPI